MYQSPLFRAAYPSIPQGERASLFVPDQSRICKSYTLGTTTNQMNMTEMRISDPEANLVANEGDILDELLHLEGAMILELGCGKAEKTRIVAQKAASVLALEVDKTQLAKNIAITDLPNVRFAHGGAEK